MSRRQWQAVGVAAVVALLVTIGAIRLVEHSTWRKELVAGMDRSHWRWPVGR